jgi:hypothetical protein
MATATELKRLKDFTGDARLFQLSEPVAYDYDYDTEQYKSSTEFVVVSAADVMFSGPETYIFPANAEGEVIHWGELDGSFKGGLDHRRALTNAGFEVMPPSAVEE